MLKVAYQEESMSSVDTIGEEDVSDRNLRDDVGNYEDLDVDILTVVRLGEREEEEEEEEEFEDYTSNEDDDLEAENICEDGDLAL